VSLLEVSDLDVARGGTPVIRGVSLDVGEREAVSLLGRNGMGKTTLLRAIMGLERVRNGRVAFQDADLTGRPTHAVARMGIGYVPRGRGVFPEHSVEENLLIGLRRDGDPRGARMRFADCFRSWRSGRASTPAPSPVASSRCWPSAGACCCNRG
jgi:branched-chain amino acid transport system ATP-binding protein